MEDHEQPGMLPLLFCHWRGFRRISPGESPNTLSNASLRYCENDECAEYVDGDEALCRECAGERTIPSITVGTPATEPVVKKKNKKVIARGQLSILKLFTAKFKAKAGLESYMFHSRTEDLLLAARLKANGPGPCRSVSDEELNALHSAGPMSRVVFLEYSPYWS